MCCIRILREDYKIMATSHDIAGKNISGDDAIRSVIAAKAEVAKLRRECAALRKDRDQLLSEYSDVQTARPIAKYRAAKRVATGGDKVRVCVGDVHGMRMDRAAVDAFLSDVKLLDPDEIVLGGDILECGGWLAKHQPIGFIALSDYT